jgi:hypothetical protein
MRTVKHSNLPVAALWINAKLTEFEWACPGLGFVKNLANRETAKAISIRVVTAA